MKNNALKKASPGGEKKILCAKKEKSETAAHVSCPRRGA
jgi:hypothetical protein